MKFRIEYIFDSQRPVMLMVRQMVEGNFALPDEPKFGGVPIRRTLQHPRKLKPDGTQDYSVYMFTLTVASDVDRLEVGQIAELEG